MKHIVASGILAGMAAASLVAATEIVPVSVGAGGDFGDGESGAYFGEPAVSPVADDGTTYFLSEATLHPILDTNAVIDVYRRDPDGVVRPQSLAGVPPTAEVFGNAATLSLSASGRWLLEARPADAFGQPQLSRWDRMEGGDPESIAADALSGCVDDSGVVTMATAAAMLVGDVNGDLDVYRLGAETEWLSKPASGGGNGDVWAPRCSADGQAVVFTSEKPNLVAGVADGARHLYLWQAGVAGLELLDRLPNGAVSTGVGEAVAISADGGVAAFHSIDGRLVDDGTGAGGVFVVRLGSGKIERVSLDEDGFPLGADAAEPSVSSDGRFVAFSAMTDNVRQIFLRDLLDDISIVLSQPASGDSANADCRAPSLSPSGRYVSFASKATNLATADGNAPDGTHNQVYVVDRGADFANRAPRVQSDDWFAGEPGHAVAISLAGEDPDGDDVQFRWLGGASLYLDADASAPIPEQSLLENDATVYFFPDADGRTTVDFEVLDGVGAVRTHAVTVVAGDLDAGIVRQLSRMGDMPADGDAAPDGTPGRVSLGAGGSVAYVSAAGNLTDGATGGSSALHWQFGRHRSLGVGGNGGEDFDVVLSADGRFAVLRTTRSLSGNDANADWDAYRVNVETGAAMLVSVTADGAAAGGVEAIDVSGDGSRVAFVSSASEIAPGVDNSGFRQTYLWREGKPTLLVSQTGGHAADGDCLDVAISALGNAVAFSSGADNLGGAGGIPQIYLYWCDSEELILISQADGSPADGECRHPDLSQSGRFLAYESLADNLTSGTQTGIREIFLRDMADGQTQRISVGASSEEPTAHAFRPSISDNGRFVCFRSRSSLGVGEAGTMNGFLLDRSAATLSMVRAADGTAPDGDVWNAIANNDGSRWAFVADAENLTADLADGNRDLFMAYRTPRENAEPGIAAATFVVQEDTPTWLTVQTQDADGDDVSASVVGNPMHGAILEARRVVDEFGGLRLRYAPEADFFGEDALTVRVDDGQEKRDVVVSIHVQPVDDPLELVFSLGHDVVLPDHVALVTSEHFSLHDVDSPVPDLTGWGLRILSLPTEVLLSGGHTEGDLIPDGDFGIHTETDAYQVVDLVVQGEGDGWQTAPLTISIVLNPDHHTWDLGKGWNLIALPFTPYGNPADFRTYLRDERGLLTVGRVYGWNPARRRITRITSVAAGDACWVYVREADQLTLYGEPQPSALPPLVRGWNLRGVIGSATAAIPADAKAVWRFNGRRFVRVGSEFIPGDGYWIYQDAMPLSGR